MNMRTENCFMFIFVSHSVSFRKEKENSYAEQQSQASTHGDAG